MTATARVSVTNSVFDYDHCANTIERVLMKAEGVKTITIADGEQYIEVHYDQSLTDEERVEQIVAEWGYRPDPEV
jgi:copper chaperone CopZ